MGMNVVYERCCGIDVHKKKIVACFRESGHKHELKEFGTMTGELREMADWLIQRECQMVAMESTGNYWRPIFNVLELLGLEIMVVNAQHMKTVPGRKTDTKDAEWISDLLRHGLLKPSYIPEREQRELRDVSRYRKSLTEERAREINRLEKILQSANIKLSSVSSDITSVSAKNIVNSILKGKPEEEAIASIVYGPMKQKIPEIMLSIDGMLTMVQKKLVRAILDHIDDMTKRIDAMDNMINGEMKKYEDAIKWLDDMPGIGESSAQTILAEIGLDMSRFYSDSHLAAWSGLCPGNNESAGKRKKAKTRKGNKTLKSIMIQCAKSAVKCNGTFFKAQYERLVGRRGYNRATTAVAHSMIIAIYHMLKNNVPFKDLGSDYYRQFDAEKQIKRLLNKLTNLGWEPSTLAPV